ncbi:hypothetical protein A7K93_01485 [Candidatus Methylacidiphilum fumarolicum]|uniref:Uncharacterized protein n=2 Tax=Candidatus Methylacidiphilum fumarolicum TaxID=591154 RepID=I0JVW4_METFB|nr:hypothetical protein A7K73_01845 [Candidatus Methylacidiphilum fumarolicum]TFE75188.1 hypothetical protein A7K93_01485 [Candidatus Methylacidiphilum fumarolicum]TFE76201.1 hypothetical protein A7K72_00690 [Candidatus Methylacidiphilum fumarolicum]CAI9086494.1 conserved protein of unknown function [Candidatus Methylacidiphilum fumarolicum]CCG91383.1 hypothetical protein MFUM_1020109 [Methylacidiphilum fumariolicum SolV]
MQTVFPIVDNHAPIKRIIEGEIAKNTLVGSCHRVVLLLFAQTRTRQVTGLQVLKDNCPSSF